MEKSKKVLIFISSKWLFQKRGEKSMNAANKYRLQRELQVEPDVRHK